MFKTLIKALAIQASNGDEFSMKDARTWWNRTATATAKHTYLSSSNVDTALMQLMQLGFGAVTRRFGSLKNQRAFIVYKFHMSRFMDVVDSELTDQYVSRLTGISVESELTQ